MKKAKAKKYAYILRGMSERNTIYNGDVMDFLRQVPDESVHCVVTSPPYWNLRDYGVDGQIGLEKTPDEYVQKLVVVFREVRRTLRKDGTLWLNLGDSYCSRQGTMNLGGQKGLAKAKEAYDGRKRDPNHDSRMNGVCGVVGRRSGGLRPKNLLGMPWRVAFALQEAGWILRSDIIWAKPNPMPESVQDRPTRSHECVFLLVKSDKYFYDAEAIREPMKPTSVARLSQNIDGQAGSGRANGGTKTNGRMKAVAWIDKQRGHSRRHDGFNDRWDAMSKEEQQATGANKRSVWWISPQPFRGAHFATFPEKLVETCIKAGVSAYGVCADCGAPYRRIVSKGNVDVEHQRACGGDVNGEYHGEAQKDYGAARAENASDVKARILAGMRKRMTTGWERVCQCAGVEVARPLVMDPFMGAGTVAVVAKRLGADYIGVELNPAYCAIIEKRLGAQTALF